MSTLISCIHWTYSLIKEFIVIMDFNSLMENRKLVHSKFINYSASMKRLMKTIMFFGFKSAFWNQVNVIFWELFLAKNGHFSIKFAMKIIKISKKAKAKPKKHQPIISCFSSIFQRCHFSQKQRENLKSKLNTKFSTTPVRPKFFLFHSE